jgi:hypothetical protein
VVKIAFKAGDPKAIGEQLARGVGQEVTLTGALGSRVHVDPESPTNAWNSLAPAFKKSFTGPMKWYAEVIVDAATPRRIRVTATLFQHGRTVRVGPVNYLARLRTVVPEAILLRIGRKASVIGLDDQPELRERLREAKKLHRDVRDFLNDRIEGGSRTARMRTELGLVPDEDGALLTAWSMPHGQLAGLRGHSFALEHFLAIADEVETLLLPPVQPRPRAKDQFAAIPADLPAIMLVPPDAPG